MVITNVNQVVYQGDGVTTAFPFTFRIIDATDIKLLLLDSDGTETDITSDYYVDITNNTVYYPPYYVDADNAVHFPEFAPGQEPPMAEQPPVLAEGQKLVIYRKLPITQERDLGDKWPFYVIELGLDKLTMILQDIWDWLGRCLYVSKGQAYEAGDDFNPTVPLEADKVICGNANGTGFDAREALMEVNGQWDGEGRQIKGVADPADNQDAVTKKYVDDELDTAIENLQLLADVVVDSGKLQHITDQYNAIDENAEAAATSEANALEYKNAAATSAANAASSESSATTTAAALIAFLEDKESLTAPAVDATLSISGAAADAQVTGNRIEALDEFVLGEPNFAYNCQLKTDGTVEYAEGFCVSDYFAANDTDTFKVFANAPAKMFCLYDSNKDCINYKALGDNGTRELTPDAGTAYIRTTFASGYVAKCQNTTDNVYVYTAQYDDVISALNDKQAEIDRLNGFVLNGLNFSYNCKLSGTGSIESDENYCVSDYIPINDTETFQVFGGSVNSSNFFCFYDANKNYLGKMAYYASGRRDFTAFTDSAYIRMTFSNGYVATCLNLTQSTTVYTAVYGDIRYALREERRVTAEDVARIDSNISAIQDGYEYNGSPILYDGYIDSDGTVHAPNSTRKDVHTEKIKVYPNADIVIDVTLNGGSNTTSITIASYDADDNFIKRIYIVSLETGSHWNKKVNITDTKAKYVIFSWSSYGNTTAFVSLEVASSAKINAIESKIFKTVKTIGHRGDNIMAPECTAPSYVIAKKNGIPIVENDLNVSEDGEFVMWHDADFTKLGNMVDINGYLMYTDGTDYYWVDSTDSSVYTWDGEDYVASAVPLVSLTRCAGANYDVNSNGGKIGLNLDILKRIDFGVYKGSQFKGTQLLTFEEWVLLCKQLGLEIRVDKKITYTQETATEAASIVRKLGMKDHASWAVSSSNDIEWVRNIIPDACCGTFAYPTPLAIATYAPYNTGKGFFFSGDAKNGMTEEAIQSGLNAGFIVEVYYVNITNLADTEIYETIRNAVNYGVNAVTVDHYKVSDAFRYLLED